MRDKRTPKDVCGEAMYRTAISQFEIIANNIRHGVPSRIYTQRVVENVSTKFKVFDIV